MRCRALLLCLLIVSFASVAPAEELPLLVEESFDEDLASWQTSDPPGAEPTWTIQSIKLKDVGETFARSMGGSKYEPPYRSPWNIALLKEPIVGDFDLSVRVQNTNYEAGDHRDLCIFWGYQDPAHFYYVHLGAKPDPHSCQIFVVDGADRKMITDKQSTGTPWGREWHQVEVRRNVETGSMEVYFDDLETPLMTANDKRFTWGRVGLGTFDDHGNFDDFKLRGTKIDPVPATAQLPNETLPNN